MTLAAASVMTPTFAADSPPVTEVIKIFRIDSAQVYSPAAVAVAKPANSF